MVAVRDDPTTPDGGAGAAAPGWAAPGGPSRGDASPPPVGAPPPSGTPVVPSAVGPPDPFAVDQVERERILGGAGYSSPRLRTDGTAVAAMVLGVVGIVVPGLCLVAIALGHVGLHRLKRSYSGGRGLAIAGLVLGYAGLALWLSVLLLALVGEVLLA